MSQRYRNEAMSIKGDFVTLEEATAFEHLCEEVLRLEGFENLRVVGGAKDEGTDIIGFYDDKWWSIQCKCWTGCVSSAAVRDAYGGAGSRTSDSFDSFHPMLLVNGTVSPDARIQAEKLGVVIHDGNWLKKRMIRKYEPGSALTIGYRYTGLGKMELKMNEVTMLYKIEPDHPVALNFILEIETKVGDLTRIVPILVNDQTPIHFTTNERKVGDCLESLYRDYPFGKQFMVSFVTKVIRTNQGPILQAEEITVIS